MSTICCIGGGNMATAIIGGLLAANDVDSESLIIHVAEPRVEAREQLEAEFNLKTFADSNAAIEGADAIVLAVKPQIIPLVLTQIGSQLVPSQLLISIAAGTTCDSIEVGCGKPMAIIRAMPNTPALIGEGITGLYANALCGQNNRDLAKEILSAVGQTLWIDNENLMDAVTAVSGSGPAYAFLLIEAMRNAGVEIGLSYADATTLATYTVAGAGSLALSDSIDVTELRQRVTSPGGTTAAALAVMQEAGLEGIIHKAVIAARDRGRELAEK